MLHLIHYVRIGLRQIKVIKRLHLLRNTKMKFVRIVEEENSSQQRTLAHTLGADEVYVSIQLDFRIAYVRAIDEDYFP